MFAALLLVCCLAFPRAVFAVPDEDPFKVNEEMVRFLETNINRSGDGLQQLRNLVRVVFEENALGFKYDSVTRTAIDTFNTRRGNCMSFTFLFLALARELGFDARLREVDVAPVWSRTGGFTTLVGHVNVGIHVGSQWYVVDLFPTVNRIELGGRLVSDARALAHFFNNRGVDSLAKGELTEAIEYFHKSLAADSTVGSVWCNLGVALNNARMYEEAEESYKKALQLDSGDMVAMNDIAALYERMGRDNDSKRWLDKARKFRQRNPYYHYSLGVQAYDSGNLPASVNHFKEAIKRKGTEHNFYLGLARAYLKLGDTNKARECLQTALKYATDESSKLLYNEKLTWLAGQHPNS
jgi:tetratricopeptide (TPR) repeat protein